MGAGAGQRNRARGGSSLGGRDEERDEKGDKRRNKNKK